MNQLIQDILRRIEVEGQQNDANEEDHAKKCLNLEPETGAMLAVLLKIANARRVLEIGTSTGYSTLCIAAALQEFGGRLTTIERDRQKQFKAQLNIAEAGLSEYVDWNLGDATEIVANLEGPYDCVFFDADRISAPAQLELLLPKLAHPALLLADNALSHPEQIQGYLDFVRSLPGATHIIVLVGKGLSVAYLPG